MLGTVFGAILLASTSVPAEVVEVIDGDTFKVEASSWPGMVMETKVRVAGIDTPEKGWRAECARERKISSRATAFARDFLAGGPVMLHDIQQGTFGGRVIAEVTVNGVSLGEELLARDLAVPYKPGRDNPWCKGASNE